MERYLGQNILDPSWAGASCEVKRVWNWKCWYESCPWQGHLCTIRLSLASSVPQGERDSQVGEKIIYLSESSPAESHNITLPKLGPIHFVDGEPEAQSGVGSRFCTTWYCKAEAREKVRKRAICPEEPLLPLIYRNHVCPVALVAFQPQLCPSLPLPCMFLGTSLIV